MWVNRADISRSGGTMFIARIELSRLTILPLIIPVVAIKNRLPFVCFDIHLNAEISVYVQPPKKNTTVVVVSFLLAAN